MGQINTPELITTHHSFDDFSSGEPDLDHWLKQRALKNHQNNASRTFVAHQNMQVIGYYCLAAGSVTTHEAPGKIKRNMPNPIPVMVLGRLAVDKTWHDRGLGKGLLKDALLRTATISREVGVKALLVHTLSDTAKHFYKRFGFMESPLSPMTLMLSLKDIQTYF